MIIHMRAMHGEQRNDTQITENLFFSSISQTQTDTQFIHRI